MITPTPWQALETVICKGQSVILQMEINSDIQTAKDNCAFIGRAVNSHYEMLNLLKGFVENLDLKDRHDVAEFSALVYKAIAKAEGKPC